MWGGAADDRGQSTSRWQVKAEAGGGMFALDAASGAKKWPGRCAKACVGGGPRMQRGATLIGHPWTGMFAAMTPEMGLNQFDEFVSAEMPLSYGPRHFGALPPVIDMITKA